MIRPEKLIWDSEFLNISVGKLIINDQNEIECGIDFEDFDLIYIFSDVLLKNNENYIYQGTKVKFQKKLGTEYFDNNSCIEQIDFNYFQNNLESLKKLAYISGQFSRFNVDKNFGLKTFHRLYNQWVENAINKVNDNVFLVFKNRHDFKPIALLTGLVKENNTSKVGLLSVDVSKQGNGIGSLLLKNFENYSIQFFLR